MRRIDGRAGCRHRAIPGFRWGTTLLPGDAITRELMMDQLAVTYPYATVTQMTGATIKTILEDVADNLFNPDPYYQQGGDMVRVGGLRHTCEPGQKWAAASPICSLAANLWMPARTTRLRVGRQWLKKRATPGQTHLGRGGIVAEITTRRACAGPGHQYAQAAGVTNNPGIA